MDGETWEEFIACIPIAVDDNCTEITEEEYLEQIKRAVKAWIKEEKEPTVWLGGTYTNDNI